MSNEDDTYKAMAKEFLDLIVQKGGYGALDKTKGLWFHRDVDTHVYAVIETEDDHTNCAKAYALLTRWGIQTGRFGGAGEHRLDRLVEKTKIKPSKLIISLAEEHGMSNLAVLYTEKKLEERELEIVSEFVPDFWYLGILSFDKEGEIEAFHLK